MILGLGHPRTGTGFTSKLCQTWGLDVGHEKVGLHGVIDWRYITPRGPYPFVGALNARPEYDTLVYNVRNPKDALGSIIYTEDMNTQSLRFRKKLFTIPFENRVEQSIASMIAYDDIMTEMKPDIVYRVEDQQEVLFDGLLSSGYDIEYKKWNIPVNTRDHLSLDDALGYYQVSQEHQILINTLCSKYDYPHIDF